MIIDHIQLACPAGGEARAREFFVEVVGMVEEEKPGPLRGRGGCWFRKGKAIVHVGIEMPFLAQRKAHPGFVVEELEALAARLVDGGFPVRWDETLPEMRRFYTEDPFGNRLEFLEGGFGGSAHGG